jgi:peptide/nickel transport system substrate-binding protein
VHGRFAVVVDSIDVGAELQQQLCRFDGLVFRPCRFVSVAKRPDTGRPSEHNSVWEFTLKAGAKWSDGSPVTCEDVKYGIERRYASSVADAGGLPYPMLYLKDNATPYTGPYNMAQLDSIVCADQRTVQFHLQRSVGDFGYTASVNTFAPVKVGADRLHKTLPPTDPQSFQLNPISNGPYKVDPTQTKVELVNKEKTVTHMVLVRNDYWDSGTDSVRRAYPERIAISFDPDSAKVTNDLINSAGTNRNAINLDLNVSPNFVQQVINDPVLSKRAAAGPAGGVLYFAINVKNEPKLECRQALEYAFDKRAWRAVLGGSAAGELATTMIPPSLAAHPNVDPYGTANFPDGDPDTAKKLLARGGCRTTVNVAFRDLPVFHQLVNTVVDAYARVGLHVNLIPINPLNYIPTINRPDNNFDMMYSGWLPDWPNGSAIIPPLFDGAQTHSTDGSNLNFSELDDPDINDMIQQAYAESVIETQLHLWGQIDERLVKDEAAVIPIIYPDALRMMGTNVRGVVVSAAFGEPDLAVIGLGPDT